MVYFLQQSCKVIWNSIINISKFHNLIKVIRNYIRFWSFLQFITQSKRPPHWPDQYNRPQISLPKLSGLVIVLFPVRVINFKGTSRCAWCYITWSMTPSLLLQSRSGGQLISWPFFRYCAVVVRVLSKIY